jgi:hypothetical protein
MLEPVTLELSDIFEPSPFVFLLPLLLNNHTIQTNLPPSLALFLLLKS